MAVTFGELQRGVLVRRYKRFLADVWVGEGETGKERETGENGRAPDLEEDEARGIITIHCPNTGSMKNCAEAGDEVFYSTSANPARKYAHTWELSRTSRGHYIGINTNRANALVRDGILSGVIEELSGYGTLKAEVPYEGSRSRADFWLGDSSDFSDSSKIEKRHGCYVEVKSVTLLEHPVSRGIGFFPDAVSERGSRHLRELMDVVRAGGRAIMCFCVQHSGIKEVRPAAHIDPLYAATLREAIDAGVVVIAYKARLTPRGGKLVRRLPVVCDS